MPEMTIEAAIWIMEGDWYMASFHDAPATPTKAAYLAAAQLMVDTDMAWQAPGHVGRRCAALIDCGLIRGQRRHKRRRIDLAELRSQMREPFDQMYGEDDEDEEGP